MTEREELFDQLRAATGAPSTAALAQRVGESPRALQRLQTDDRRTPNPATSWRLLAAYLRRRRPRGGVLSEHDRRQFFEAAAGGRTPEEAAETWEVGVGEVRAWERGEALSRLLAFAALHEVVLGRPPPARPAPSPWEMSLRHRAERDSGGETLGQVRGPRERRPLPGLPRFKR